MAEQILKGKRVLFFYLSTFNYEVEIRKAMEKEGAVVDSYNERPTNSILARIMIRINRNLLNTYINKYYDNIMEQTKANKYDYILFIKGESVSRRILEKIRAYHPEAKMIMYVWDSVQFSKNAYQLKECFDKFCTFDSRDSKDFNIPLLPLFYIPAYAEIANKKEEKEYDLMFVGTIHNDRYEFIKGIAEQIERAGGKCFTRYYFPSKVNFYKQKWDNPNFRSAKISDFVFVSMPRTELLHYYSKSLIQIDIQDPLQTGLTMRTIETLGAKKKLITTNKYVKEYDFYHPNNILVVDRTDPIIDKEFLKSPYVDIPVDIYNKYSISSWLNNLFS